MNQMLEELLGASGLIAGATILALPPDNPREASTVATSAMYAAAIAAVPRIFETGGEGVGATFTSIVLLMHMLALTGKDEPDVARKNEADLKSSANSLIAGVLTFAFLISAIQKKKEYYSTTAASAKAWMVSMLGTVLFLLPDIPFPADSYKGYLVRQVQYIVLAYVIGFFISGIVKAYK